ncbi:MAG TPA: hypothetical protein VMG60_13335 [Burkholderiaceae bacterium]|nr:hypothetical protein [Burkholderiaceae bacterium]
MSTTQRRSLLAILFWVVLVVLVLADRVHGAPRHDRFDAPLPRALGSGSVRAQGAHCMVAPRR